LIRRRVLNGQLTADETEGGGDQKNYHPRAFNLLQAPETLAKSAAVGLLAQLVERLVYTENVGGSSPSRPTISPSLFFSGA
jgi:hypothetical protein